MHYCRRRTLFYFSGEGPRPRGYVPSWLAGDREVACTREIRMHVRIPDRPSGRIPPKSHHSLDSSSRECRLRSVGPQRWEKVGGDKVLGFQCPETGARHAARHAAKAPDTAAAPTHNKHCGQDFIFTMAAEPFQDRRVDSGLGGDADHIVTLLSPSPRCSHFGSLPKDRTTL